MDQAAARQIFDSFLQKKEQAVGFRLAVFEDLIERTDGGWVFYYQGAAWVKSRENLSDFLVGHGPVVLLDNGEILEGGSLDRDPSEIVRRHRAER